MSRGHGRMQRFILDKLARRRWAWLRDLLPRGATKAEYASLYRAANKLADGGEVELKRYMLGKLGTDGQKLVVSLPGCMPLDPKR